MESWNSVFGGPDGRIELGPGHRLPARHPAVDIHPLSRHNAPRNGPRGPAQPGALGVNGRAVSEDFSFEEVLLVRPFRRVLGPMLDLNQLQVLGDDAPDLGEEREVVSEL
eukprot:2626496-Heterocapsa_arctica.AAC.1